MYATVEYFLSSHGSCAVAPVGMKESGFTEFTVEFHLAGFVGSAPRPWIITFTHRYPLLWSCLLMTL